MKTKTNPLLLCDFYKTVHSEQYPKSLTKLVSYYTPRKSLLPGEDKLVLFGLQGFIMQYLIDCFNDSFFSRPKDKVLKEYNRILTYTLGPGSYDSLKISRLHDLGFLPLEIKALPEGTRVPVGVPMIEISNTHPDFAWVVNSIETLMSVTLWHTMLSANVGYEYRQIVNHYYDLSVDDNVARSRAMGDFSMRGQESLESAAKASAAFCLSFLSTATIPAILYLENFYGCNCQYEDVAYGAISTEHSVMCSNYAVDGDEETFFRRLLTQIYPNHSFSVVCDSYDYWNVIGHILPRLRKEIMAHNGTMLIRGDSGNPVDITTDTVFRLWKIFGGTVNSKGYRVLDPHIRVIYGDSITQEYTEAIYETLLDNGFACNNVVLGVGSFSFQCRKEQKNFYPYTRDSFGVAVKSTYAEFDGKPTPLYKNPKTDETHTKKSHRGLCRVYRDANGELAVMDNVDGSAPSLLQTVFYNGALTTKQTLQEIRSRLHDGQF